jgi:translation initiation factor RLI1
VSVAQLSLELLHAENNLRPQSLLTGMNKFLASLEITFRRDPTNYRPRINKLNSVKDKEQKGQNLFFHPLIETL